MFYNVRFAILRRNIDKLKPQRDFTPRRQDAKETAEKSFQEVLRRGGKASFVHHNLGVVDQYQALRESAPQDAEYAYQLGRAYTRLSEWSSNQIIRIDPDAARLHQSLGQQYLMQGKYEMAAAEYKRAAEVDPKLTEIHLALALIYLEQKRFDESLKEIEKELKLAPGSKKAMDVKQKIEAAKAAR